MSARVHHVRILGVVGAVLLMVGAIVIVLALRGQRHAPEPPAAAGSPVSVLPRPTGSMSGSGSRRSSVLARSTPTHISVPAIGVDSDLRRIGLNHAGEIRTPPLGRDSHAYWLNVSPTPGQLGPATIIGHVDSAANGPAVFFRLGDLRQRDHIRITRADGRVAVFAVERVVEYPKARFPTHAVYGNTNHAALRLITCGGIFDPSIHSYESNIVAFASLVSYHHGRASRH